MFRRSLPLQIMLVVMLMFMVSGSVMTSSAQTENVVLLLVDEFFGDQPTDYPTYLSAWAANLSQEIDLDAMIEEMGVSGEQLGDENVFHELLGQIVERIGLIVEASLAAEISGEPVDTIMAQVTSGELDIEDIINSDECVVNLEGQGYYVMRRMAPPSGVAHGTMVRDLVDNLAANYRAVAVENVETGGFTIGRVTQQINDAIQRYAGSTIVINMSFAIVPCGYVADLLAYEMLIQKADELGEVTALRSMFEDMINNYASVFSSAIEGGGELRDALSGVIPIASSGNFGRDFQFAPAAWPEVIGVSGSGDEEFLYSSTPRDSDSNVGEVMMPGYWSGLFGTSFAAPRLSYLVTLSLQTTGEFCWNALGNQLPYDMPIINLVGSGNVCDAMMLP